ncbi:MAG: HAD family phosphatase [Bacilli bacterium]|nr:HAD family phosphatase [Bacilli bacterium]
MRPSPYQKLLALDMDGTLLLPGNQSIGEETLKVLKELIKDGVLIVIASGRPYRSMVPFYNQIGCQGPMIIYNGMAIVSNNDPDFPERAYSFKKEEIREYYSSIKGHIKGAAAENEDKLFVTRPDEYLDTFFPRKGMEQIVGPLDQTVDDDVFTFIVSLDEEEVPFVMAQSEKYQNMVFRRWRSVPVAELFYKGADKGHALEYIAAQYGIDRENIYAFGDSENDREMLLFAGHPYVMNNATSESLKSSFPVTEKGNADEGVASTLKKIFDL